MTISKVLEKCICRGVSTYRRRTIKKYRANRKSLKLEVEAMHVLSRSLCVREVFSKVTSAITALLLLPALAIFFYVICVLMCQDAVAVKSEMIPGTIALIGCVAALIGGRDLLILKLARVIRSAKALRQIRIINDSLQWFGVIVGLSGVVLSSIAPSSNLYWFARPVSSWFWIITIIGAVVGLIAADLLDFFVDSFFNIMKGRYYKKLSR